MAVSGGGRPSRYLTKSGTQVPGVTTVIGKYKDPGPLMYWSWKLGTEGVDYRQARDDAGGVGHLVHAWIEADIHGAVAPVPPPEMSDADIRRAREGFRAYQLWREGVKLLVISTETPLVSELHGYGGTIDCVALVNGKPALLDWKSGSGIYPEVIAQLAAYRQLLREHATSRYDVPEGAYCLRVGKEMGDFHYHGYTGEILDAGWRRFLGAKMMFDEDKILKKVCA